MNLSLAIQDRILEKIKTRDAEIVERFEKLIDQASAAEIDNADVIFERFLAAEKRLHRNDNIVLAMSGAVFPASLSAAIGLMVARPMSIWRYGVLLLTVASFIPFLAVLRTTRKVYYQGD